MSGVLWNLPEGLCNLIGQSGRLFRLGEVPALDPLRSSAVPVVLGLVSECCGRSE